MYFFPRREFTKESLVTQSLGAQQQKSTDSAADFEKVEDDIFKDFQWDPSSIVPAGLESVAQMSMLTAPASSSSTTSQPTITNTEGSSFFLSDTASGGCS